VVGVAELVDRAVALPPGPELSAALHALPRQKVPNARLVEVAQARSRQLAHEQAELFADLVEITHAVAVADLPGNRAEAVARSTQRFEWASHEIAAGLTWTPTAADRELGFATALVERLPLVHESLRRGHLDRGKARVFVEYLDPANGDLTEAQARRLCERFVPQAPGLTTKQLSDRLFRALHAIDPELRRRRYQRAVQQRGVALYLDPRTGTATLVGNGLPPDEAAAAAERIDRLVEAAKRAGHPGRRAQISADVYLAMLNGSVHGLTENEIINRLLATHRPEDHPDTDTDTDPDTDIEAEASTDADADTGTAPETGTDSETGTEADAGTETAPGTETETGTDPGADAEAEAGTADEADRDTAPGAAAPAPAGEHTGRWAGDRVATREGIEIRVGLATLAGLDDRPAEIPGLGPIGAHLARDAVSAQRRGASWKFAIVDTDGYLLLAGPLRRRPRGPRSPLRFGAGWSSCTSPSRNCAATAPTRSWATGTRCWPRSPMPGPTATSSAAGWPPTRTPGSPAAHSPITSASATAAAAAPAAPARHGAATSTTPETTPAAARPSRSTSARRANATTPTRKRVGR
jgi:hypothetical protein